MQIYKTINRLFYDNDLTYIEEKFFKNIAVQVEDELEYIVFDNIKDDLNITIQKICNEINFSDELQNLNDTEIINIENIIKRIIKDEMKDKIETTIKSLDIKTIVKNMCDNLDLSSLYDEFLEKKIF